MPVSGDDLGKLVPYAVPIAHWLKENNPKYAADCLVSAGDDRIRSNVENSIEQFLAALDVSNDNLSNAQLRYILSQYNSETWSFTLKKIICEAANPSVIQDSVKEDLVKWAYHFEKDGGNDWNELFAEIGKSMNELGHTSFKVLGEFCSMIRDCSQQNGSDRVATAIAADVLHKRNAKAGMKKASGSLFCKLVTEAERIFGQSGDSLGIVSFGIRSKVENTQWSLVHTLPPEKKRIQDLRTFYSYIDKKFVGIVDDLFRYHEFVDIAEAVNNKYGMIPAPWKTSLNNMKAERKHPLTWFDYNQIRTPTPGAHGPPKARNSPPPPPTRPTRSDELVNNFIDTEILYYRRLGALGNVYSKQLFAIASKGTTESKALMLTGDEIDKLFGYRFQKVLDLTHQLLTSLEVINVTRKHVKGDMTREQILARIVKKVAKNDLYSAYSQYSVTYPECADLLKKKSRKKQVNARNGAMGRDFFDVWDEVRQSIRSLEDKKLEEALELPVKRIHNYREFLKELLALSKVGSQKHRDIEEAHKAIRDAAQQLTNASAQAQTA